MFILAADVQAVAFLSIIKPMVIAGVLILWGKWASRLDKDAEYYYLPRSLFNAMNLAIGALAFALWLLIPIYILGMVLALMVLVGGAVGYILLRNQKVPPSARWQLNASIIEQLMNKRRAQAAQRQSLLRFIGMGSRSSSHFIEMPDPQDAFYPAHLAVESLLSEALQRGAQRFEIGIAGSEISVQMHIDGVKYKHPLDEPAQAAGAVDYLKKQCGLDVEDRRRKQQGQIKFQIGELGAHEIRFTTAGSTRGYSGIVEIDPHQQLGRHFDKIGLLPAQVDQLKPVLVESDGLVIVATPADQGRTTTLYALLQQHDPYLLDIHTLEERVEADVEGLTQHTPEDGNWAKSLNSLLLRDPAVMMLSHVPDQETAKLAAQAAVDQKRIYISLRADDTLSALRMWAKAVGDLDLVAKGTRAVVSQRLVRKLCPACRQAYQPDPAALAKLNLPADRIKHLFKSSGKIMEGKEEITCPTCHGLGYKGRTGVFEVMVLDDQARQFLKAGDLNALRSHVRKNKMLLLQEAALAKVMAGETSISEVNRALASEPKKPQAAEK